MTVKVYGMNIEQLSCSEKGKGDIRELMSALAFPSILAQDCILLYKNPFVDS